MDHNFLANFWFFVAALVWAIYVFQELFSTGIGMLSIFYWKDERRFRKFHTIIGTHWDGIQVWLILAIGGMFATFPVAYANTLTALYIPIFLLLYCIILRGISIELIYKTSNVRYQFLMKYTWSIASLVLIFVVGTYLTNQFTGLPITNGIMNDSFFSFLAIFSPAGLAGGLLFVVYAIVQGYLFLTINSSKDITAPLFPFVKWASIIATILLILVLTLLNSKYNIFADGLYADFSKIYLLPILTISLALITNLFVVLNLPIRAFICSSLTIVLFLFSGFSSMFPFIGLSTTDPKSNLLIIDAAASKDALLIMFVALCILLPIILFYQIYKYYRFWGDVQDDELE